VHRQGTLLNQFKELVQEKATLIVSADLYFLGRSKIKIGSARKDGLRERDIVATLVGGDEGPVGGGVGVG